jgi:hypothetical protein
VWNTAGLEGVTSADLPLLGLFGRTHMEYEVDRPRDAGGEPSLSELAVKAMTLLEQGASGRQGYFLMVEAGRIDHAHHAGNAYRQRAIIEYDESELRMNGIARGWSDVVGLGVDSSALQVLELTGRTQRRFGFEFVEWHSAAGAPPREVWWSDEAAAPLRVAGIRPSRS